MQIRTRIKLTVISTLVVVIGIVALLGDRLVEDVIVRTQKDTFRGQLASIAHQVKEAKNDLRNASVLRHIGFEDVTRILEKDKRTEILNQLRQQTVGSKGVVFVVDYQARIVDHPTLKKGSVMPSLPLESIKGEGDGILLLTPDGQRWLSAFLEVPEWRLIIIFSISESELYRHKWSYFANIGLAGMVIAIAAYLFIRIAFLSVNTRLSKIIQDLEQVRDGDYGKEILVDGSDEIGVIQQVMSKMLQNVRAWTSELQDAKLKAEAANRAKSEFLANMSHEIRTPMNAVLGFTEILKNIEKEPKKAHYLETIQLSGKTLLSLINDILDLSKIEAGKIDLQYAPFSIQQLLMEVEMVFKLKASDLGLGLITKVNATTLDSLLLDETRIRQIVFNLISNALKFTEKGSIVVIAEIVQKENASQSQVDLTISVEDTGIGIALDQHEKIFESFEQVAGQKKSKFGGTGLGLAICRRITEMMNGNLSVTSELGKGSKFTLYLPDIEIASTESQQLESIKLFHHESIAFEPATILIVDDIDYNRELLAGFLSSWEFVILEAENGQTALEQARKHQPDLILMDMRMPVMDGYEATEKLKQNPKLKAIPIIAVTASALKGDEARVSEICDGYIRKPISHSELIGQITSYLPFTEKPEDPIQQDLNDKGTTAPLIPPPADEMAVLHDLARIGDMCDIEKRANHIATLGKQYIPFANKLRRLAEDYEEKTILKMVERYLPSEDQITVQKVEAKK